MIKLALLHTRLSGYLAACLREFKSTTGAEIMIYAWPNQPDAPFDVSIFEDLGVIRNRNEHSDESIVQALRDFRPNAILTSGWVDRGYQNICREFRKRGVPVIAGCDTQWSGTLRQQVAAWTSALHVQRAIDVLWVTGERQAQLGRSLGYSGNRLWDGYYACDWQAFAKTPGPTEMPAPPFFLYVGRYAPEKGLDTLVDAYEKYCQSTDAPWKLVCAGTGPLRDTLLRAGVEDRGFVQPHDLPALMHQAAAFILPSQFEPWGVVAHEAATAGLPLILSDACGASVHLLKNHLNGFQFPAGDSRELASCLERISSLEPVKRHEFGEASFQLSKQFTPTLWSRTLIEGLSSLRRRNSALTANQALGAAE